MVPIQNETNIGNAIEVELYSEQNQRNHQIESNRSRVKIIIIGSDIVIDIDIGIDVGFESKLQKKTETIDFQPEIHCYRNTNPIVIRNKTNQTIKLDRTDI